MIELLYD